MSAESASISSPAFRARAEGAPSAYLSTSVARRSQRRLAIAVVAVSALVFAAAAPFAKAPLPPLPAFLPIYQSALVINELITAVLLFGQFGILRSRALLLLASAYLFSAAMAVAHLLSFPGLFAPGGLLGAGSQTTAWIYFLWHGGFPLFVLGYAFLKEREDAAAPAAPQTQSGRNIVALSVVSVLAAAAALTLVTTVGHDALPAIMRGDSDASSKFAVASVCWALSLVALAVMWRRRSRTLVDLWLMVTLCVWIFEIALAAVLNAGRYDLGWYAGRVYGLLAGSFVLMVLLLENGVLHARVATAREHERRRAVIASARHEERLRIVHEIDRAIIAEAKPEAIAAAVLQPLRALLDVARANINLIDVVANDVEWFASAGRRRTHIGEGVRFPMHLLGDVTALARGEAQVIDTRALPPGKERDALLETGVLYYMAVPMISGEQLLGALSFGGERNEFPEEQVAIAHEVATQLAVAIGNARLYERVRRLNAELEHRVRERTAELETANKELESFSYSVSHDLRAPLRAVHGYSLMLDEDYGARLDGEGRRLLAVVRSSAEQMGRLIDDLLKFSQVGRRALVSSRVDMRALAGEVIVEIAPQFPQASVELGALPEARGDCALLRHVWVNLIANALKYSARAAAPRVEVSGRREGAQAVYSVRDNGAGFDMRYYDKLFNVFQRLHRDDEFEGTGVGLAIVQRVVTRHGGRVWAEGAVGAGAVFHFALGAEAAA